MDELERIWKEAVVVLLRKNAEVWLMIRRKSRAEGCETNIQSANRQLEAVLLDQTCSVSFLFGGGGGDDGDEVNSIVSCRRYHISYTVMSVFLHTCHFHFRLLYRKVITVLKHACRLVKYKHILY
jgi:hypothetical protein